MEYQRIFVECVFLFISIVTGHPKLTKIEDDFWDWRMKESPSYSTFLEYYTYDDRLQSFNISDFPRKKNDTVQFAARLSEIHSTDLSSKELIDMAVLNDTLQMFIHGTDYAMYGALNPVSFIEGVHIYYTLYKSNTNSRGDFENYIARLLKFPKQIDEIIDLMQTAIRLGRTLHNVSIELVPALIDKLIVSSPEMSTFYSPFNASLDSADSIEMNVRDDIRNRASVAVTGVIDSYKKLKYFILSDYLPNTRVGFGVSSLDGGADYYRACLSWHLSFDMSPEDVHSVGLQEVNRIHGKMFQIIRKLGFNGTVSAFFSSLENDTRFVLDDADEIIRRYEDIIHKQIQPKLTKYFKNIPDIPIIMQKLSYDGIGGGYGAATENSPGKFYINLYRPRENPTFEYMALALHEANPGHHLQHIFALKTMLPEYRRQSELSFYDVPAFFPYYTSYSEGWGLYSEFLGEEMGLYNDEYDMMGRYSYEIFRAARLVVDTGLHYYNWSQQHAIDYMKNYTAFSLEAIEIEVNRYITWPGQACAYKLGEIRIRELRSRAELSLGDKFDIRDFHAVVLENGAVPLSVLETLVDQYIDFTLAQPVIQPTSGGSNVCATLFLTIMSVIEALRQHNGVLILVW